MAYFIAEFDTLTDGVVTGTVTRVVEYPDATSCQAEETAVTANEAAILAALAQSSVAEPAAPSGKAKAARNCLGGSTDEIEVIGGNDGYVVDGTTPTDGGTTTPTTPANYDDAELVGFKTVN